jgi:outer membrane protein assembly factor BamB
VRRIGTTTSCRFIARTIVLAVAATTFLSASDQDADGTFRVFPSAIAWTTEIADGPIAAPVIVGDHVVVAMKSGEVVGKRLVDGGQAWMTKLVGATQLAGADEVLFVALEEAAHALNPGTGQVVWTRKIRPLTAPVLVRGGWIVLAAGEELTALNAADGQVIWTRTIAPILQRSTIDGDALYVPLVDGRLLALDLASGSPRWEQMVGANPSEALAYGDRVYVGAGGKRFVCVDVENGAIVWAFTLGAATVGVAAADEARVYVASMDNLLRAFRRSNGARDWIKDLGYRPVAGPIITGSSISVPGRTTTLRALDPTSRKVNAELTLPAPAVTVPAFNARRTATPGVLAVITNDYGKPWLLVLAAEPAPSLSLAPLTVLPGTLLPIPKYPL